MVTDDVTMHIYQILFRLIHLILGHRVPVGDEGI
ncbi:MAG: hypothetical protein ACJAR1_000921 [Rubritalea sp.]|jgi:hypothetical protein